jgi:hypothetical protein
MKARSTPKAVFIKTILVFVLGIIFSTSSTAIAKFSSPLSYFNTMPSGVTGGWPVAFIEYDFTDYFQSCPECTFATPSGNFLIIARGFEFGLGKIFWFLFVINTLFWTTIVSLAILLASTMMRILRRS